MALKACTLQQAKPHSETLEHRKKEQPLSLQLEKGPVQQQRPSAAKNKF